MATTVDATDVRSAIDRPGKIESRGVEYIPDDQRTSDPKTIFTVFLGMNFSIIVCFFGWLPIALGLSLASGFTAAFTGLAVGTLFLAPMILLGPRTGTNNPISSGAHFGIIGRTIGSALGLFSALIFVAIAVWTSGDALVAMLSRLFGIDVGDGATIALYSVVALGVIVTAVYGHATIVFVARRVLVPVGLITLLLGFVAFVPDATSAKAEEPAYALGAFWPTWILAAALCASGPVSYMVSTGDYGRYVSRARSSDGALMVAVGAGLFIGAFLPLSFGLVASSTFAGPVPFVAGLVAGAPGWYVAPLIALIITGALGQGTLGLYSSSLDLSALLPRVARVRACIVGGVGALILAIVGAVVFAAIDSINAVLSLLIALVVPWAAINLCGLLLTRGAYDPHDLQAFAQGRRGGRYWYRNGWNPSAVIAWLLGGAVGLLSASTSLYVGPIARALDGTDLSIATAGVAGAFAYGLLVMVRPSDRPPAEGAVLASPTRCGRTHRITPPADRMLR